MPIARQGRERPRTHPRSAPVPTLGAHHELHTYITYQSRRHETAQSGQSCLHSVVVYALREKHAVLSSSTRWVYELIQMPTLPTSTLLLANSSSALLSTVMDRPGIKFHYRKGDQLLRKAENDLQRKNAETTRKLAELVMLHELSKAASVYP